MKFDEVRGKIVKTYNKVREIKNFVALKSGLNENSNQILKKRFQPSIIHGKIKETTKRKSRDKFQLNNTGVSIIPDFS